jgi:dihydrofolate reductase
VSERLSAAQWRHPNQDVEEFEMRKVVAGLFMSLDGVMESPEKWTGAYMNDEVGQAIGSQFAASDAMLLGRRTYETFAGSFAGRTDPMAAQMNNTPKYVVSETLKSAEWENSTVINGDVVEAIKKLKAQPGKNIAISGSPTLVRWLLRNGLLDELNLIVPPIVVGGGRRLFEGADGQRVELVDCKAFSTGVLSLTYAPAAAK